MVVAHAHTQSSVWLEASIRRYHLDPGWFVRVLLWKFQDPKVVAALVRTIFETENAEVKVLNAVWMGTGQKVLKHLQIRWLTILSNLDLLSPLGNGHGLLLQSHCTRGLHLYF